jgi:hypothetical protein
MCGSIYLFLKWLSCKYENTGEKLNAVYVYVLSFILTEKLGMFLYIIFYICNPACFKPSLTVIAVYYAPASSICIAYNLLQMHTFLRISVSASS